MLDKLAKGTLFCQLARLTLLKKLARGVTVR